MNTLTQNPRYLLVHVTSRCNAACSFCCNPAVRQMSGPEITPEQSGKIAAGLGHLFHLAVSGGEPFLRDDLAEWIDAFCRNTVLRSVTIATNGSMPERVAKVLEILTARHTKTVFTLVLSVDAHGVRHDAIRSFPGLFNLVRDSYNAARKVRSSGTGTLRLILSSVLSSANEEFFLNDLELLRREFPEADSYEVNLARPNQSSFGMCDVSSETYRKSLEWVTRNRFAGNLYHNIHQALFEKASALTVRAVAGKIPEIVCRAGRGFATVNSSGQVILCEEKPDHILGDLRNYNWNLRALLTDPEIARKASVLREKCFCRSDCVIRFNLTHSTKQYPALAVALAKIILHKQDKYR